MVCLQIPSSHVLSWPIFPGLIWLCFPSLAGLFNSYSFWFLFYQLQFNPWSIGLQTQWLCVILSYPYSQNNVIASATDPNLSHCFLCHWHCNDRIFVKLLSFLDSWVENHTEILYVYYHLLPSVKNGVEGS